MLTVARTLTEMVPLLGSDELKPFQAAVPKLLEVIDKLVTVDEVRTPFFDNLSCDVL